MCVSTCLFLYLQTVHCKCFRHLILCAVTATVTKNKLERQEEQGVNIMESVWEYVKRQKQLRQTKSTNELWQILHDAWKQQPAMYLDK